MKRKYQQELILHITRHLKQPQTHTSSIYHVHLFWNHYSATHLWNPLTVYMASEKETPQQWPLTRVDRQAYLTPLNIAIRHDQLQLVFSIVSYICMSSKIFFSGPVVTEESAGKLSALQCTMGSCRNAATLWWPTSGPGSPDVGEAVLSR